MEYMEGMQVLNRISKIKCSAMEDTIRCIYRIDVERALSHESCSIEDFKALYPGSSTYLEQMAERQKRLQRIILEIRCTFLHRYT